MVESEPKSSDDDMSRFGDVVSLFGPDKSFPHCICLIVGFLVGCWVEEWRRVNGPENSSSLALGELVGLRDRAPYQESLFFAICVTLCRPRSNRSASKDLLAHVAMRCALGWINWCAGGYNLSQLVPLTVLLQDSK